MVQKKSKRRQISEELIERACSGRHRDVEQLLKEGADTEVADLDGYTAISEAAMAGHTPVVGMLLRAGANPNAAALDGRTALHRAALNNFLPAVKLLVENGANPALFDSGGKTAADLTRHRGIKEFLDEFPADKLQEAMEVRRAMMAERPKSVAEEEAEQAEAEQVKLKDKTEKAQFEPPPRQAVDEADEKAAKEAAAKEKRAEVRAAEERKREERYKRAIAELRNEIGLDKMDDLTEMAEATAPADVALPRLALSGAGDRRLNGTYLASYVTKDRVEFEKAGDRACHIMWSDYHDEWRILIADHKLGSTLFRHRYRPNIKFDECHGVPQEGWQKWFGTDPEPKIRYLSQDEPDYEPVTQQPDTTTQEEGGEARKRSSGQNFLEVRSSLDIVSKGRDDYATMQAEQAVAAATGLSVHRAAHRPNDVRLQAGDGTIVETSEGLFSSDEVLQEQAETPSGPSPEDQAVAWVEDTGSATQVPADIDAILAAKSAAQELFNEGKVSDARQATSAAIKALKQVLAVFSATQTVESEKPTARKEEMEGLCGVLHSNRSLLLTHLIQASDPDVLAFGQDAAWRLVVRDCNEALQENSGNFKASFRRAKALFELGELEDAMIDATRVVDHYTRNSSVSNPEAAALRKKIMEAIKKERGKWGDGSGPRWNHSTKKESALITELGSEFRAEEAPKPRIISATWASSGLETKGSTAGGGSTASCPTTERPLPAPRTGADVEKALLSTAKSHAGRQLAYIKEHVTADALRRFYRKTPLGPDLLATMMQLLLQLAHEDVSSARERLAAIAASPFAKTQSAMFNAEERASFDKLLVLMGPDAAAAWQDLAAGGEGGA
eukprot:TRINITY_DN868_c0_g1_i1.p1 TRINITY_DN868_c0_g1~~TRINITY_DN868_c0_g1_i1.p1  ORF type:complete len:843 (-),score=199.46 TRINITY_DN868_c0_g1_i1:210-2738(-)